MLSIDLLGYSAALAVLAAFCMSSILSLRIVAILSNVLFALYGLLDHLYPIFLLHSILLPINIFKLTLLKLRRGTACEVRQVDRRSTQATEDDLITARVAPHRSLWSRAPMGS